MSAIVRPGILAWFAILLLSGCAQLPLLPGDEDRQTLLLLRESQRFGALGAEAQRRELALAARAHAGESDMASRVRLALLLGMPGTAVSDDGRALALLEPLVSPTGGRAGVVPDGALVRLAALLHAQIAERVREERRAAQLKQQLDALRAIERTLLDRGRPR